MKTLQLKENIFWVGALDPELKVFDIIMETEFGTTYNSYLVKGSNKTVLFETVKVKYFDQYIDKLKSLTNIVDIDYIVVNHTEPDHAGSIEKLLDIAVRAKIVGSEQAIDFLKQIANRPFEYIIVKHGDTIDLGNKTLKFISAPFLHWPDSIYTYIPEDKVLFTCDSFGSHYSFDEILYSKIPSTAMKNYKSALRYYFTAIFSPFKEYVLQAIEKIKELQIDMLCVGHGPVIDTDVHTIIDTYKKWATVEKTHTKKTVVIPFVSAYGFTTLLSNEIAKGITSQGDIDVKQFDINCANYNDLKPLILKELNNADGILFGTSTINGDALPPIWDLAVSLNPITDKGKVVSAFGSYGWSGEAVGNIISRLNQLRMFVAPSLKVRFKPAKSDLTDAYSYGIAFAQYVREGRVPDSDLEEGDREAVSFNNDGTVKKWKCTVCGEVFEGVMPPKVCPACGVGQEMFEEFVDVDGGFKKNTGEVFIIIGSGAAGITAAEAIRKRNSDCTIKIITKDSQYPYYRPVISDYLSIDVPDSELYIKDEKWYIQNRIEVLRNIEVLDIKTDTKNVLLNNNQSISYDKLIIASGARAHTLPIVGSDKPGVFTIRTLDCADRIKKYIKDNNCKNAFFIGGGVLGLEAASAFRDLGLSVSIIERESRIFPRQLDEEGSAIFENKLLSLGVRLFKKSGVKRIAGDDKVIGIELDDDQYFNADIIIISAGIRANKQLAEKSGMKHIIGIQVDSHMKTSQNDIYACGDAAEFEGKIQGLWATASLQGEIAGANATGDDISYVESLQPVTFSSMETPIFSVGDICCDQSKKYSVLSFHGDNGEYKKLFFNDSKLIGGILIGDISKSGTLLKGVKERKNINAIAKNIL
ncbi:MAG: hypothetical protein A2015_02705 [Spirochaetes bacterium GWF1_31_7]|nr:MAG: hypothetical protein A2Y30_15750 [Spirochaetes bacterium GWE1_32_154]OHD47099.1 MAG: hypothetical protein A2015_02705 [Spirochaetes bacterium GWF1_31_7]OHD51991.1 MAG: hypothetical protein A2Y29_14835 [Spirochaetes bacterium GWE2_31_10]